MCEYIVGIDKNQQPVYADDLPQAPSVLRAEVVNGSVGCERAQDDAYVERVIASIAIAGHALAEPYGSELLDRVV